jgi:hypothetical protein
LNTKGVYENKKGKITKSEFRAHPVYSDLRSLVYPAPFGLRGS